MRVSLNGYFLSRPNTGSGQYAINLREHLSGVDVAVALPPGALGNMAKVRWEQLGWPAAARRDGTELLHSPYFALPWRRRLPAVVTIHDLIPLVLKPYRGSLLVRAYTLLQVASCRSAEAILVDSQCTKRDVLRLLRVPPERVHVVYLGVDRRFSPDRTGEPLLDRPYVLYVGSCDVRKNVPALIRAFGAIAPEYPRLVLAIAGDSRATGPLFDDVPALAAPLGDRVRLLGRVTEQEKLALYRHAELFVFPSLYEGFGLEPLEALACGCPVACSNASSLPEIVGGAAVLFDPRRDDEIAAAMRMALSGAEGLRELGPARAGLFSWCITAEHTARIYRQALDGAS